MVKLRQLQVSARARSVDSIEFVRPQNQSHSPESAKVADTARTLSPLPFDQPL